MTLQTMAPRDLLRDALLRHSANASDPYFRYILLRIAAGSLFVPDSVAVLGEALDDT
jgi:hypothetical protein